MKITHLLLLAATAQAYQGEWCDECTTIVDAFDALDANTIADQICPLIGYETICEDIAPYMIDWIQDHVDAKTVCEALCNEDSGKLYIIDDDYVPHPYIPQVPAGDPPTDLPDAKVLPPPTEDPPANLHVAKDLHHHPFDIPPKDPPANLHVAKKLHHHPFDEEQP